MPQTLDQSGANNMSAIKDRITKTLSDATRDMSPLETFAQVGRAASQAATSNVTFGDALNAMNAKRMDAVKQMSDYLNQQKQLELQEQAGSRAERGLGLQEQQLNLQQDQFGLQQQQFESGEKRASEQAGREERRLGMEEDRLNLSREELTYKRLQDAQARGDADADAVVSAINNLVPEDQRAIYAARLGDMQEPVDRSNVVSAIGKVRKQLEAEGGVPDDASDFKDVTSLRKQFEALSEDYITVRDSYGTIIGLADQLTPELEYVNPANAGPGDLSFIFAYMKMLDPGSTVREGEMATAENARGVGGGVRNIYNRIMEGAKLTPDQRKAFIDQAASIYKQRQVDNDRLAEGYRGIAERNKMDPDDVVLDFAGPYRYRTMSEEELAAAAESATSQREADAIMAEFERRFGSIGAPGDSGSVNPSPQSQPSQQSPDFSPPSNFSRPERPFSLGLDFRALPNSGYPYRVGGPDPVKKPWQK